MTSMIRLCIDLLNEEDLLYFGIGLFCVLPIQVRVHTATLSLWLAAHKKGAYLMDIQALREFVEFSKHLNFSAAARCLHMSQSCLSKHIADLEKEVGFPLVDREAGVALTVAGRHFLTSIEDVLYSYDSAVEKCRQISREKAMRIVVQDPMVDATIGNQAIPVFMYLSEHHPNIDVTLHTISGQTITEALQDGTVDIGYLMAHGPIEEVIAERASKGITAVPLRKRRFSAWMSKDHSVANKEIWRVEDLENMKFLVAADRLFDDWRIVLEKLCRANGFVPRIQMRVTPTINGYLAGNLNEGVVVLSDAWVQDPRFLMRQDMTAKILEGHECHYHLYFVYRTDNDNPALPIFANELEKQALDV